MRAVLFLLLFMLGFPVYSYATQETLYVRDYAACANNGDGSSSSCAASPGGAGAFAGWFQVAFNASDETAHAVDPGDLVYICGAHTGGYFHGPTDASGLGSGTVGKIVTVSFDCPGMPGSVTADSATTVNAFGTYATYVRIVNPIATGGRETLGISDSLGDATSIRNVTIVGGTISDNTYATSTGKCISLRGRNIIVDGVTVRNCYTDGIWGTGKFIEIKNSHVSLVSVGDIQGDCYQFSGEMEGLYIHDNDCDHTNKDSKYCIIANGSTDNGYIRVIHNTCTQYVNPTIGLGIFIGTSPGIIAQNTITNGLYGAICNPDAGEQCDVIGNLIVRSVDRGVSIGGPVTLSKVINNTIIGGTVCIELETNQAGLIAANNIIQGCVTGITKDAGSSPVDLSNLFYKISGNNLVVNGTPTTPGTGSLLNTDPLFVSSNDYRTQANSPVRRAGVRGYPCFDVRGRPCWNPPDIGAYQASSGDPALRIVGEIASDDFNRAGGGLGSNWTTVTGFANPQIVGNLVQPNAVGGSGSLALYTGFTLWPNDQYSEIKVITASTSTTREVDAIVRGRTTGRTQYECKLQGPIGASTTLGIWKYINGVNTNLASTGASALVASGDIMRCEAVGNRIRLYLNGVQKLEVFNSHIPSGIPGILLFTSAGTTAESQLDNWAAGSIIQPRTQAVTQ